MRLIHARESFGGVKKLLSFVIGFAKGNVSNSNDCCNSNTEMFGRCREKSQNSDRKVGWIQAGLKNVSDAILRLTAMIAAIHEGKISEVSQETSGDSVVISKNDNQCQCAIKKVDEFKAQATEGEAVLLKLQPQVSTQRWPKLVCGNQQVLTHIPTYFDIDEDEDDFIVLEGHALE